jgi:hypothetical protein
MRPSEKPLTSEEFYQRPRSIEELAKFLNLTPRFITAEIARGNLKAKRLTHSVVRLQPNDIQAWIDMPDSNRVKGVVKSSKPFHSRKKKAETLVMEAK